MYYNYITMTQERKHNYKIPIFSADPQNNHIVKAYNLYIYIYYDISITFQINDNKNETTTKKLN